VARKTATQIGWSEARDVQLKYSEGVKEAVSDREEAEEAEEDDDEQVSDAEVSSWERELEGEG
jgi:hypothetical protein